MKNPRIRTNTTPERLKHLKYLAESGDLVARDALACGKRTAFEAALGHVKSATNLEEAVCRLEACLCEVLR